MKTIIIVGYVSGIVYQILCTDIIKIFASGSKTIIDGVMEDIPVDESMIKLLKLVADLIMFVGMIITIMLWPIGIIYDLYLRIKYEYWKIRFMIRLKRLRKSLLKMIEERD